MDGRSELVVFLINNFDNIQINGDRMHNKVMNCKCGITFKGDEEVKPA